MTHSEPGATVRVLLVGKGPPERGGIPTFLQRLCDSGSDAHGVELRLLNLAHGEKPEGGRLSVRNAKRTALDFGAVWRQAAQHDVVHVHTAASPTVTMLRASALAVGARLQGTAVVLHIHGGNLASWLQRRRNRLLFRLLVQPARRVVTVWSVGQQMISTLIGGERAVLIDNGVDCEVFGPTVRRSHVPRVLFVGLLTPRKGVLDLLDASRVLHSEGVQHELVLIGGVPDEGPEAAEPVLVAAKETEALLLGTLAPSDMPAAYAEADVFCLPSWWEAMPLSILEAMASGLPVVATAVGDVPRLVEDGVTGLVVAPRAPGELAAALKRVLEDRAESERMGSSGRRRAETAFSWQLTWNRLQQLYRDVAMETR